jgi:hypothetical protein
MESRASIRRELMLASLLVFTLWFEFYIRVSELQDLNSLKVKMPELGSKGQCTWRGVILQVGFSATRFALALCKAWPIASAMRPKRLEYREVHSQHGSQPQT